MTTPHITVLMATCNGARFLSAQLDSLLSQTHKNWSLIVSDDGSTDGTAPLLRAFDRAHPQHMTRLLTGPQVGSCAQNFMSLLTLPDLPAGLVALADQDDVWLPCKLSRAADHLAGLGSRRPAIYASDSTRTDANLRPIGGQRAANALPGFHNALVQNIFSGHTTVLNPAALALIRAAGIPRAIVFHDWWLYQLVAGAGGTCLLDPARTVLYRQHDRNVFGAPGGMMATVRRAAHLLRNDYGGWLHTHWRALHAVAPLLTPAASGLVRDLLDKPAHESRAQQICRLGLRRGTPAGTAALWLAAGLGRI